MILYKKGSLFESPKNSILVHAVSTKSVWGSGIAKEFKIRFPESFKFYKEMCNKKGEYLIGTSIECPAENKYTIVNLVTSIDYGNRKDSKELILANTCAALYFLLKNNPIKPIYSNMFNSGLFQVDWVDTEKILNYVLCKTKYRKDWTVYKL